MNIERATPAQLAAHMDHKARLARIEGRSVAAVPPPPAAPRPAPAPRQVIPASPRDWFASEASVTPPKTPTVEDIMLACARHFGVKRIDIKSARRTAIIVRPRQVAMYLSRNLTPNSLPLIGRRFGGRDHTTVLHAIRKIERLVREDWMVAHDVATIEAKMGGDPA